MQHDLHVDKTRLTHPADAILMRCNSTSATSSARGWWSWGQQEAAARHARCTLCRPRALCAMSCTLHGSPRCSRSP
jgi:hypothetical protein